MTALISSPGTPKLTARSIAYIDGFNLYYGAVRGTPSKWLNLQRLFHLLRPDDDLRMIRYFTALVTGNALERQKVYQMIRNRFPDKQITVYVPSQNPVRSYAVELKSAANKARDLPANLLAKSQFDSQVSNGSGGYICKPQSW